MVYKKNQNNSVEVIEMKQLINQKIIEIGAFKVAEQKKPDKVNLNSKIKHKITVVNKALKEICRANVFELTKLFTVL